MRVLVVDNDPTSKANAKLFLQGLGLCEEAEDGNSALACFRSAIEAGDPYDLVLVDIQVTDTSDGTILKELRAIEVQCEVPPAQQARIFVTTALAGRQLVTDCLMHGGDEFLAKPLDKNRIHSKLKAYDLLPGKSAPAGDPGPADSVLTPATIFDAASKRLKTGDLKLPPAPKIAMKLRQLIDFDADLKDVVDLLKQDLAVATKLISVSNSAFYRGIEKNTTLSQATSRLGLTRTREVVMSICCQSYFATNHPVYKEIVEKLWWHSLACAHTAEMIVHNAGWRLEEDIFSVGLLHDIGKLFLIQIAGDLQHRKHAKQQVNMDDLLLLMDDNHERLGATILQKLGYPDPFVKLVSHHHRIGDSQTSPRSLQVLQQADLLAKAAGFGLGRDTPEMIDDAMQALGISRQVKDAATTEIVQRVDQLRYVFG